MTAGAREPAREPGRPPPRSVRGLAAALAGPALVVGGVLLVLAPVAFGGRLINGDLPTLWLPTYCYLGRSLVHGHIPTWNPYTMAGVPFAADPQSGWMYFPVMALFTALPCGAAIRWMTVLQPIGAGLALLWFLRTEGVSRAGAATGAVTLALGVSGAHLVASLPFSAVLAWTAVLLALAARYVRASRWSGRLGWAAFLALAWGQLAAAHLSIGLLMGTGTVAAYLVGATVRRVRSGEWTLALAARLLLLPLPLAGALNLAYFLPRLAYQSETSLGLGYARLQALEDRLAGLAPRPRAAGPSSAPTWPLDLAAFPGLHLGAVALALSFSAWWSRRHRATVVALSVFGAACYVLTLRAVSGWVARVGPGWQVVDFYLHRPEWWGYAMVPVIAALAGVGLDVWGEPRPLRRRLLLLGPGVAVWGVLPPALGANPFSLLLLGAGAAGGAVALAAAARRPALSGVVPVALAGALLANSFSSYHQLPFRPYPALARSRLPATIDVAAFLRPSRIEEAIRRGPTGRRVDQLVGTWTRLQADPRSTIFRVEQAQGYEAVQLLRYWTFVRAVMPGKIPYNLSIFLRWPRVLLDLLQVRYAVAPAWPFPGPARPPLARAGSRRLYEVPHPAPRAQLVGRWRVVRGPDAALRAVTDPGFDPRRDVVLEQDPGLAPSGSPGGGMASYRWVDDRTAAVEVDSRGPSVLLVRNPYARGWQARVDGREVPVMPADYVDQGVPVPAGRHRVVLAYREPTIGYGLAGSAAAVGVVGVALVALRRRERASGVPGADRPGRRRG